MAIVLKTAERTSSVSRAAIRKAVATVYGQSRSAKTGRIIATVTKKASSKKSLNKASSKK